MADEERRDDFWQPVLAFEDQAKEFAHGFECGRVWGALQVVADRPVVAMMHVANNEMILRMGEATERKVRTLDVNEAMVEAVFLPAGVEFNAETAEPYYL